MKLLRGGVTIEREVRPIGKDLAALRQRFTGTGERFIVTHDASMVARVEVLRGRLLFGAGIEAPRRFVLSVPPRSTVRIGFEDAVAESDGRGRMGAFCDGPPQLRADGEFTGTAVLHALDPDRDVEAAVALARRALHAHLSSLAPVRAAARAAGLAPDTLTRAFERAYGVTPKRYVTKARLFDAAISIFLGAPIAAAALASGFNDLSRFYAQFRQLLTATPGEYARASGVPGCAEK
ncbi:MAG: AraC family transcriptional regulator [Myxococcaceae bacterium]|nr:AraC family transcriptional regulator [Myxococcaceae bacterium]